MAPAIGIDLGTTFSRVAVFRDGKVEVIENEIRSRATPSYVAFTDKGRLVGDPAKRQAAMNSENTIYNVKRLIGRRFSDRAIQEDMKHWPFDVVNSKGKPMLKAKLKGEVQLFAPEEISASILGKMKDMAENFLGTEVKDAVITVPAYFNDSQRQATKDAGTIAGLNVLQIINEPSAAALAYSWQKDLKGERNVLIYDFGGGTFDATVLTISNGSIFEVRSTSGNTYLGGEDFDRRILQFLAQEFLDKHGKHIQGNPRAMCHLRDASEAAKRDLSSSVTSTIDIDLLFEGIDFETQVSQETFNYLCLDLFQRTLEHVKLALANAKMDTKSIDDIVLVGGSTRIPKVQELLREFFYGKALNHSCNQDEAVVYGAAIQATILSDKEALACTDFLLIDVIPLSIGLSISNGKTHSLMQRNTQVPDKLLFSSKILPGESNVTYTLLESEGNFACDKTTLGTLVLYEIPVPTPKAIDIKFELDVNGILTVSLLENCIYTSQQITLLKNNLLEIDIVKMVGRSQSFKKEEQCEIERMTVRSNFESYIYKTKSRFSKNEGKEDEKMKIHCQNILEWLGRNPDAVKEEYEKRMHRLETKVKEYDEEKKLSVKLVRGRHSCSIA